jgi:hypothetical protein
MRLSRRGELASFARGGAGGYLGSLPRALSDEVGQGALAIWLVTIATAVQKLRQSVNRWLRAVAWSALLLLSALIWSIAVCLVLGASSW